ncbi:MAG: NUDIX domain-containing protein [Parvibaculaceae bacterium]|nr:NUDIX domain-containing protein [Parvibaculaceae bacterium]
MESHLVPSPRTLADIDILERRTIGQGWGKLERFKLRHRRYDGAWSAPIERDLYTIAEVMVVIPYDPALDAILLVEQFRTCGLHWGEATWLVEGIAGIVEPGEDPRETARREAVEEGNCEIRDIMPIMTGYSSPGGYGERAHLFAARADLSGAGGGVHGLADEGEDIRALVVSLDEAYAAGQDGRIQDLKTVLMVQWLVLNRARLQGQDQP